jgi:hypothetical protein
VTDDSHKSPLEQAVDVFVYAPIGLFFEGPSLLPKLVNDGKGYARNARVFGEFAVRQGRAELQRRLAALEGQAAEVLRTFGMTGDGVSGDGADASDVPAAPAVAPDVGAVPANGSGAGTRRAERPVAEATATTWPAVGELAITDYDSLSASQVVTRLHGLDDGELEAVRAYEIAHRGRKTILNKVAQLQA